MARSDSLKQAWGGLVELADKYFITTDAAEKKATGSIDINSIFGNTQSFKDKMASIWN